MQTHRFRFIGRHWTVFRREGSLCWYIHVQRNKRRIKRSLGTADLQTAISRAKLFISSVERGDVPVASKQSCSSVQDVIQVYLHHATVAPRTARNNVLALSQIVRTVLGLKPADCPLTKLDASLVRAFQTAMVRRYCAESGRAESQRDATERALCSSRSFIQQARSLFAPSRGWPELYAKCGLTIPDSISSFMSCPLQGSLARSGFSPPSDEVIQRTIEAFRQPHGKTKTERDAFVGFWFALGAGLRRREVARLRWEQVVLRDGQPWISGGIGKDGLPIEVPIQLSCWEVISRYARRSGPVLLTRGDRWARLISARMAALGWRTQKRLHELRAYIGSLIYAVSPISAMRFLRHKSIRTTERFYVRYQTAALIPQVQLCAPSAIPGGRPQR